MYNFNEIKIKLKEINRTIMMCGSILKITLGSVKDIQNKFDCCKHLNNEYNIYHEKYATMINDYNNIVLTVKNKHWASDNTKVSMLISKLIGHSKRVLDDIFKFDKKLTNEMSAVLSSKGKNREIMISLINLPPPPNTILKGGTKSIKHKKNTRKYNKKYTYKIGDNRNNKIKTLKQKTKLIK